MKYILITIILALLILVVKTREPLPEVCNAQRNDQVYDIAMKDTVIVYSTFTGNNGMIMVRNKYGKQYVLKCGEYS